ncbi:hypothetical protein DJ568_09520 [Mucilaginibacter hurinus]|uniref:TonB C-terminal domain-containing protein n=1 Tax=Mucilaginibacter hurinus TaxID=2201324 RepID=A0A367GN38_9SPHI|nr:energy transducer TonB [Mucilaginibacter hurinus]RCH54720.1 hypothetical protein DJ568_09520 [Mucilaginibacter hurinus]
MKMKQCLQTLSIMFLLLFAQGVHAQQDSIISQADTAFKRDLLVGPQFPGGFSEMNRFLEKNLKYLDMTEHDIQGKVYIEVVVEKDGSLSSVIITKGVSGRIDKEALRLVSLMPAFVPGTKNGLPARFSYSFPLNFALQY